MPGHGQRVRLPRTDVHPAQTGSEEASFRQLRRASGGRWQEAGRRRCAFPDFLGRLQRCRGLCRLVQPKQLPFACVQGGGGESLYLQTSPSTSKQGAINGSNRSIVMIFFAIIRIYYTHPTEIDRVICATCGFLLVTCGQAKSVSMYCT